MCKDQKVAQLRAQEDEALNLLRREAEQLEILAQEIRDLSGGGDQGSRWDQILAAEDRIRQMRQTLGQAGENAQDAKESQQRMVSILMGEKG
jgi:hypothetical protein